MILWSKVTSAGTQPWENYSWGQRETCQAALQPSSMTEQMTDGLGWICMGVREAQVWSFPNCLPLPAQRGKSIFLFVCLETKVFLLFSKGHRGPLTYTSSSRLFLWTHKSQNTKRHLGLRNSTITPQLPWYWSYKVWSRFPHAKCYFSSQLKNRKNSLRLASEWDS